MLLWNISTDREALGNCWNGLPLTAPLLDNIVTWTDIPIHFHFSFLLFTTKILFYRVRQWNWTICGGDRSSWGGGGDNGLQSVVINTTYQLVTMNRWTDEQGGFQVKAYYQYCKSYNTLYFSMLFPKYRVTSLFRRVTQFKRK